MIANDSIAFSISGNDLTCKIKAQEHLSIIDLFDIFRVLGGCRICSWQEFELYAKPKASRIKDHDEYASQCYNKYLEVGNEVKLELINRKYVENQAKEIMKKGIESGWLNVLFIHFDEIPADLSEKLASSLEKLRDDYSFVPNLWSFKWECENDEILTDMTYIKDKYIEPKRNLDLEDIFKTYLDANKGVLYRLFNDAMRFEMDSAVVEVSSGEEEEEDEGSD